MEGYVNDESGGFANLPRQDQEKRQRAASEKNTKLRSPLFFINPLRLSIRNLHKDVDEVKLKKLVVDGIKGGLKAGLVGPEDVTAQLKAQGLPLRECVGECAEVPEFEDKNVKK
jgi:nucleolar protein 4